MKVRGNLYYVATTGAVPALVAVNDAISPVPLAASPIDIWSFVQVYVTVPPVFDVPNIIAVVTVPLHITWPAGQPSPEGLTVS